MVRKQPWFERTFPTGLPAAVLPIVIERLRGTPAIDPRLTAWEMVHHLIRSLEKGGEGVAAALVAVLGSKAEVARELAYRLYTICERKKRAAEALAYNGLVQSWPEITRLAHEGGKSKIEQGGLFEGSGE